LFGENGPWIAQDNGTLTKRPTRWNKLAHMVWIDSPAGVGFSYDTNPNFVNGDNITRHESYSALLKFFVKFPEYTYSPLYISGESYGGHYVPQLAWTILNENSKGGAQQINLQGFLVGNPWTDDNIDGASTTDWIYYHGLVSLNAYNAVKEACGTMSLSKATRDHLPLKQYLMSLKPSNANASSLQSCNGAINNFYNEIGPDIDQYDIYAHCYHNKRGSLDCEDYQAMADYLTSPKVRSALHVRQQYVTSPWTICSDVNYVEQWDSVVQIYPQLIAQLGHVMVYSGDVTWNCDMTGSQRWIATLNMTVTDKWQAYYTADQQVAGFYQRFSQGGSTAQFTFATVRNAGHMCAAYEPDRTYKMFENFMAGKF
jgi:carboxypeptidase C (cathepsin A)